MALQLWPNRQVATARGTRGSSRFSGSDIDRDKIGQDRRLQKIDQGFGSLGRLVVVLHCPFSDGWLDEWSSAIPTPFSVVSKPIAAIQHALSVCQHGRVCQHGEEDTICFGDVVAQRRYAVRLFRTEKQAKKPGVDSPAHDPRCVKSFSF